MKHGPCLLTPQPRICLHRLTRSCHRLVLACSGLRLLLGVTLCLWLFAELLVLLKVDLKAQLFVGRLIAPQADLEDLLIQVIARLLKLFDSVLNFVDVLADLLLALALALTVLGHRLNLVVKCLLEFLALLLKRANFIGLLCNLLLVSEVVLV